jgi:hypothetical protein
VASAMDGIVRATKIGTTVYCKKFNVRVHGLDMGACRSTAMRIVVHIYLLYKKYEIWYMC